MRLSILTLGLLLTSLGFAGGVATGTIGGGDTGSSEPVPVGSVLTLNADVVNGASSVQFEVYDSSGNLVYISDLLLVSSNNVSMTWTAPFADTFTIWAESYDSEGGSLGRNQVLIAAVFPPEATGFITGGGFLGDGNGRQTFGFVAQVQRNGSIRGSLEFQDHGSGLNVKSAWLDWVYAPNLSEGYFSGWCTVNGSGSYRFYVAVQDNGEPGTNDGFALWVFDEMDRLVYSTAGTLSRGNLVIHGR